MMPAPRGVVPGAPSVESCFQPATDVEYYLYPSRQDRKAGWPLTVTTPGLIFPTVHIQYMYMYMYIGTYMYMCIFSLL